MESGNMGRNLYLIDFGLCKKYRKNRSFEHIPYRTNASIVGTSRYMSMNTHQQIEYSRRDDMLSLGYMLVYLIRGQLPWQDIRTSDKKIKNIQILERKKEHGYEHLTEGLPSVFLEYFSYCSRLEFEEDVDYYYLIKILMLCAKENQIVFDYQWDWTKH